MQVISKLIKIPNNNAISADYVMEMLHKLNIIPLRWAIISVSGTIIVVSVASLQK